MHNRRTFLKSLLLATPVAGLGMVEAQASTAENIEDYIKIEDGEVIIRSKGVKILSDGDIALYVDKIS